MPDAAPVTSAVLWLRSLMGPTLGLPTCGEACLFVLGGLAEQDAALHLVLLLGLDERDHHGGGLDLVILHHGVGDVLHQSALLIERAPAERIDDDFRHVLSPFGSGQFVQRIARVLTSRRRQPYGAEFLSWIERAGGDSAFRSARRSGEGAAGWWRRRRGDADDAAAGLDRLAGQINDPI